MTDLEKISVQLGGCPVSIKATHISLVRASDTILHNSQLKTVCNRDIRRGFCGITLFGDSYCSGSRPVQLVEVHLSVPRQNKNDRPQERFIIDQKDQ